MSTNELGWLEVREGEKLNAFEWSAKVCILKAALTRELSQINRKINRTFLEDSEFLQVAYKGHKKKRDSGFYGPLLMGTVVATGLLSNVFGWTAFLFILCIGGAVAIAVWVNRKDEQEAKQAADDALLMYRQERATYHMHIEGWKEERDKLGSNIKKCDEALSALLHDPECIPPAYWGKAAILWRYVEDRRADNLKEALTVYADEEFKAHMLAQAQELRQQNESLAEQVSGLSGQLTDIEGSIAQAQINNDLNTLLTIAAIYDSSN